MKSCGVADFLLMGRQEQSKLNRFNWETGTQSWKTGLFSEKYSPTPGNFFAGTNDTYRRELGNAFEVYGSLGI